MWLLDTSTLLLHEFIGDDVPPYAILSHTWGLADEEVSFRDMRKDRDAAERKAGYSKVLNCCLKAAEERLQYAWIDTCCIDKRSSAELSEAINSMYKWYREANVCYVYLADVPSSGFDESLVLDDDAFSKSRWFTRGWTLQELLAPRLIRFYGQDWKLSGELIPRNVPRSAGRLGNPFTLKLAKITGIEEKILEKVHLLSRTSLAQRMCWASRRHTTRGEDAAYCLMGLFDVNMPILYGEGREKAFKRLQLEIIKSSLDQSIFAWKGERFSGGSLATSPSAFENSGTFQNRGPSSGTVPAYLSYDMTNIGLSINLPLRRNKDSDEVLATLRCWAPVDGRYQMVQIHLQRLIPASEADTERPIYARIRCDELHLESLSDGDGSSQNIYVVD